MTQLYFFFTGILQLLFIIANANAVLLNISENYTISLFLAYISYFIIFLTILNGSFYLIIHSLGLFFKKFSKKKRTQPPGLLHRATLIFWSIISTTLLVIDTKLYIVLSVHILSSFIKDSIANPNMAEEINMPALAYISIVLGIFILIIIYYTLQKAIELYLKNIQKKTSTIIACSFLLLFIFSLAFSFFSIANNNFTAISDAFPVYNLKFNFSQKELSFKYPKIPENINLKNKKNILFLLVESYRSDIINDEISPDIKKFMATHDCINSAHHYSSSHTTTYGVFSFIYGIHSYHLEPLNKINLEPPIITILKSNQYDIYGTSASDLSPSKATDKIPKYFKQFQTIKGSGKEKDMKLVAWIREAYKNRNQQKNYFFFGFLNSTHHNYFYPPEFEKHTPVLPENYNHFADANQLRKQKNEIFNRYKNSAGYINYIFSQIIDIFKEDIQNNNLIVVLSGDHGEEFWDDGSLGHGKTKFINARVEVPLLLCMPNIKKQNIPFSQHVDIVPTIIDYLEPSGEFEFDKYFNGKSLVRKNFDDRYIVVSSHAFPYGNDKVMLGAKDGKIILKKKNNVIDNVNDFIFSEKKSFNDQKSDKTKNDENIIGKFKKDIKKFFK